MLLEVEIKEETNVRVVHQLNQEPSIDEEIYMVTEEQDRDSANEQGTEEENDTE